MPEARQGGYYYGWNIVALTVLAQLASFGIAINCLSLFLPLWSRDLNAPISLLAFCYTAPGTGFCISAPLAGWAADKFSVRWMLSVGLAGIAFLFLLCSMVTHAWQLIALFATLAPVSMVVAGYVPSQALVSRWFEQRRGMAIGLSALGQSMAGAVLPPILAIALPALGWRHTFQFIAGFIACVCVPLTLFFVRNRPRPEEGRGFEFVEDAAKKAAAAASASYKTILTRPNFWILGATSVIAGFMSAGFLINLAPMANNLGLSGAQAASLLSIMSLTILGVKLIVGYLIDRLGGRVVLAVSIALGTSGIVAVQFAHDYVGLLAGTLLIAGAGGTLVPIVAMIAREFGPNNVGRAMGMVAFLGLFGVTAPPIVAFMREVTGGYHAPLLLLTGMGTLAFCIVLLFRERKTVVAESGTPALATEGG